MWEYWSGPDFGPLFFSTSSFHFVLLDGAPPPARLIR